MWNWVRLIVWLVIGLVVYFTYSVKHSRVQALPKAVAGSEWLQGHEALRSAEGFLF